MRRSTICLILLMTLQAVSTKAGPLNDPQQALQDILTGNKSYDRGLVEAFQRGYQRGLEDGRSECQTKLREAQTKLSDALSQCRK
jgi:hypothetical protein